MCVSNCLSVTKMSHEPYILMNHCRIDHLFNKESKAVQNAKEKQRNFKNMTSFNYVIPNILSKQIVQNLSFESLA